MWRVAPTVGRRGYRKYPDAPGPSCNVFFKTCPTCAKAFVARRADNETCSPECAHTRTLRRLRDEYEPAPKQTCRCGACGNEFKASRTRKFCSTKCARRAADKGKHRKRARRFGVAYEFVNRIRVFDRDGWKCQICGRKTPKARLGSMEPNAPELDHRVPMSKGGPHSYENTQCACRECNGLKSNKSHAGQMPLFCA
jgi:hypothetical protein